MQIKEKKTVDMLTIYSVSIATDKFIELDGQEQKVGERHRIAYQNSKKGREQIQNEQPDYVVASVFSIWGDEPTIEDPVIEDPVIEDVPTEKSN